MTSSIYFDPSYMGKLRRPMAAIDPAPFNVRKFIARRGCQELYPGCVVNLGTGIPNDMVGRVCAEEGLSDKVMITVESGIYGGVQLGGIDFGIGQNLYAMVSHPEQFDYYDGAGVDVTYMGLGELDGEGTSTQPRWARGAPAQGALSTSPRMRSALSTLERSRPRAPSIPLMATNCTSSKRVP